MKHAPYLRNRPHATTGVLLVHGILSTPRHFDFLVSRIPDEYEVHCLLLAGHGGKVEDFSRATARQWQQQVEDALAELESRCETVYVIGHSLGTLLTLTALQNRRRADGVLLLNPPFLPRLKWAMAWRSLGFALGRVNAEKAADRLCYEDLGVELDPFLLKYLGWIPNFWALLTLAARCRKLPATLTVPCYAFLGHKDEVVHPKSVKYLRGNPHVVVEMMEEGGHYGYSEEEQQRIFAAMEKLFAGKNE